MGKYRSTHTGAEIDTGVNKALNPDTVPSAGSTALITSDAVNKVQQGFAPIETSSTAANAYSVDDLLIYNGILYKAKAAIAVGDTLTVGTNIETTTIADGLRNAGGGTPYASNPAMDGTASPGSSNDYARGDHVHPSDTSKASVSDVTATRQMLAPILADPAGQAVSAGDYFIYNGTLYKALQAITSAMTAATFTGATYSEAVSGGGLNALKSALETKLLWTNPNPTSDFLPQTIQIANVSQYGVIYIAYKRAKGDSSVAVGTIFGEISAPQVIGEAQSTPNNSVPIILNRTFTIVSTGISADNGTIKQIISPYDKATSNDLMVPIYIYGSN